jgi:hypothetical protein
MEVEGPALRGVFRTTVGASVLAGILLLCIEYKSGLFEVAASKSIDVSNHSKDQAPSGGRARDAIPRAVAEPERKPHIALKPPLPAQPQPPISEAPRVNLSFDDFTRTYLSLSGDNKSIYFASLTGKKVTWTGYIGQLYLAWIPMRKKRANI